MKQLALIVALSGALSAIASAQVYTPPPAPWYIIVTPPYPGVAVAGPFDDFSSCSKSINAYRGGDYQHQYSCQIRY